MLKARTCGHKPDIGAGRLALRSQLLIHAFQAWSNGSCSSPASSPQATGTQRLRARVTTAPAATGAGSANAAGAAGVKTGEGADTGTLGAGTAKGKGGALPQATKVPRMGTPKPTHQIRPMTLILLEALGAGLIFVVIVWWTMFSGRKNGELPPPPSDDNSTPPKA